MFNLVLHRRPKVAITFWRRLVFLRTKHAVICFSCICIFLFLKNILKTKRSGMHTCLNHSLWKHIKDTYVLKQEQVFVTIVFEHLFTCIFWKAVGKHVLCTSCLLQTLEQHDFLWGTICSDIFHHNKQFVTSPFCKTFSAETNSTHDDSMSKAQSSRKLSRTIFQ